jgi:hypothetical protein
MDHARPGGVGWAVRWTSAADFVGFQFNFTDFN